MKYVTLKHFSASRPPISKQVTDIQMLDNITANLDEYIALGATEQFVGKQGVWNRLLTGDQQSVNWITDLMQQGWGEFGSGTNINRPTSYTVTDLPKDDAKVFI